MMIMKCLILVSVICTISSPLCAGGKTTNWSHNRVIYTNRGHNNSNKTDKVNINQKNLNKEARKVEQPKVLVPVDAALLLVISEFVQREINRP